MSDENIEQHGEIARQHVFGFAVLVGAHAQAGAGDEIKLVRRAT